ncbi:MAG TPA: helix-turn-helix transcriptional regulator [Thermomicrobiales bacterium]|nr:helix-turn-helix transcriptional regulator [Thermomicrobiales bacterium]
MTAPIPQMADPPFVHSIGLVIRQRREELGLTTTQLAERLGPWSRTEDIASLESSRTLMPSWIRLQRLAAALDLPIEALLGSGAIAKP